MYRFVSLVVLPDISVMSHVEALRKGVLFCFFNRSETKVECNVPPFLSHVPAPQRAPKHFDKKTKNIKTDLYRLVHIKESIIYPPDSDRTAVYVWNGRLMQEPVQCDRNNFAVIVFKEKMQRLLE